MRKTAVVAFLLVLTISVCAYAFGGPAPSTTTAKPAAYPYLIDNFEEGKTDKWFIFDGLVPVIERNGRSVQATQGNYSLKLAGVASDWYVGGMGMVLGIDATGYKSFEMDVLGRGEGSGRLKVELYDDDNGNADIEVDKNWKPMYDDLYVAEIDVNWTGWKHISIPFSDFKVEGNGNKRFDPNLSGGSGGLVKIQLICVATSQTGSVDMAIDNLELGN